MSDPVADLRAAREDLDAATAAVEEYGEDDLRAVADAHEELARLLRRYEEPATGSGDFEEFIQFQGAVGTLVEDLPEDLPRRDAFEDVSELFHRRRLSQKHFDRARERLEPVAALADRLERRDEALDDYRGARQAVVERRAALRERVADLEALVDYEGLDFDADLTPLRDPIEAYDDAVTEAFVAFRRTAPARDVLDWAATVAGTLPLVGFAAPPPDLRAHVDEHPVGEEPVPTLVEYAGYSRSKLDHYVADAGAFLAAVGAERTYLDALDAEPLTVGWPPPPADELRARAAELRRAVARFADEDTVARCRAVRAATRREDYGRLRRVAVARDALSPAEREAVASGTARTDLAAAREELATVETALAEFPER